MEQILQALKEKNKFWRLPSELSFALKDKTLIITLPQASLSQDMQNPTAAFDSWAIDIMVHANKEEEKLVEKVRFELDESVVIADDDLHCNRSLYRLCRLKQSYNEWVELDKNIAEKIPSEYKDLDLVLNFPQGSSLPASAPDSEAALERKVVETNAIKMDVIDHQLPIGVFKGKVSKDTAYMNIGHAALDIWGIKDEELYLYELKKEGNTPLGIISELMFYTNIFNDVHNRVIHYPKDADACTERQFDKFKEIITKEGELRIHSVFYAPKLHSMIDEDVLNLINKSKVFADNNIKFEKLTLEL